MGAFHFIYVIAVSICIVAANNGKRQASPPPPTPPPPMGSTGLPGDMAPPSPTAPPMGTDQTASSTDIKTPPPPVMTSTTDGQTAGPAILNTPAPGLTPDPNCLNKLDNCIYYGVKSCSGIYEPWAKENCPRYCGFCLHPNDTIPVECKDAISNCNEYQSDTCTNSKFRIFALTNCRATCNLCAVSIETASGAGSDGGDVVAPSLVNTNKAADDNSTECKDTVDYCWNQADSSCFGIYEPWATTHCPFRCGFCDEKPPCEDVIDYCSQFNLANDCNSTQYVGYMRKNCRKTCNLCALPVRPTTTATASPGGDTTASGSVTSGPTLAPSSVTPDANPSDQPIRTTVDGGQVGMTTVDPNDPSIFSQLVGNKQTFVVQGGKPRIPGTCDYNGLTRALDQTWYDGCDYVCSCVDVQKNRVICTERCVRWGPLSDKLDGCSLVLVPGECCQTINCS